MPTYDKFNQEYDFNFYSVEEGNVLYFPKIENNGGQDFF